MLNAPGRRDRTKPGAPQEPALAAIVPARDAAGKSATSEGFPAPRPCARNATNPCSVPNHLTDEALAKPANSVTSANPGSGTGAGIGAEMTPRELWELYLLRFECFIPDKAGAPVARIGGAERNPSIRCTVVGGARPTWRLWELRFCSRFHASSHQIQHVIGRMIMDSCQHSQHGNEVESAGDVRLRQRLGRIGHKLLVMSGKGGVGKSSVATHLYLALAKFGQRVGLIDVDLHGPSIPRMLGVSGMFPTTDGQCMVPHCVNDRLQVVSIESFLEDRDSAVIWRGPVKHGVIKQFISDVDWGELDYLIIDSPPGTGDEPISIAQTIPDALAVIVTTPQEIALADVRKSINFCRQVQMPILGLVENMSGFVCPHCDHEVPLLGKGGGVRTAEQMQVPVLGSLPFDPRVAVAADSGKSLLEQPDESPFFLALTQMVGEVLQRCQARNAGSVR